MGGAGNKQSYLIYLPDFWWKLQGPCGEGFLKAKIKSYMTVLTKNGSSGCSGWTISEVLAMIF